LYRSAAGAVKKSSTNGVYIINQRTVREILMMNASSFTPAPDGDHAFQTEVEDYFRAKGFQLIGYTPIVAGFLLVVCRHESLQLAYCLPAALPVSSVDVDLCERAVRKYAAVGGYVVTRSTFLPGAQSRAQELGILLIEGAVLKAGLVRV
jgi:hypothetical protein